MVRVRRMTSLAVWFNRTTSGSRENHFNSLRNFDASLDSVLDTLWCESVGPLHSYIHQLVDYVYWVVYLIHVNKKKRYLVIIFAKVRTRKRLVVLQCLRFDGGFEFFFRVIKIPVHSVQKETNAILFDSIDA